MSRLVNVLAGLALAGLTVRVFACTGGGALPVALEDAAIGQDAKADVGATAFVDAQREASLGETPAYDLRGCKHQRVRAECKDGWCKIPAGCYVAGSPETEFGRGLNTEPENVITLTNPFLIQEMETTIAAWKRHNFPDPTGKSARNETIPCTEEDCPVNNVSWFEALAYANALSEKEGLPACYELKGCTGKPGEELTCGGFALKNLKSYDCKGYRLPMVAEWEYAARAGTRTPYYSEVEPLRIEECHDEPALNEIAWYCWNTYSSPGKRPNTTMPVGKKKPNNWGLFDMLGNSGEWCLDHQRGNNYGEQSVTDPGDPVEMASQSRTARGGSTIGAPVFHRASNMFGGPYNARAAGIGFRLVRTIFP
jgi:formylglycine-generating enzyme